MPNGIGKTSLGHSSLKIRQGSRLIHESQIDDSGPGTRSFTVLADNAANGTEDLTITLDFSQTMLSVDVQAVKEGGGSVVVGGIFTDDTNTQWEGTLTAAQ